MINKMKELGKIKEGKVRMIKNNINKHYVIINKILPQNCIKMQKFLFLL